MKKGGNFKKLLIIIIIIIALIVIIGLDSFNLLDNSKKDSNLQGELATVYGSSSSSSSYYSSSSSSSSMPLDSSLRVHYKFEEDDLAKYNNILTDSQGRYDGTIYGTKEFVDGKFGQALNFDGTSTYVYLGRIMSSDLKYAFTISAWVKLAPEALQKPYNYIFHKQDDRPGIVINSNGNVKFCKWYYGSGACITSSTTITEDKWYYITHTFDGTTFKAYINGQLVGSSPNSIGRRYYPGSTINIGRDEKSSRYNRYFKGAIDDVKVWNRALTPTEIINEYSSLSITRSISGNNVVLNIVKNKDLNKGEILMIAEEITGGPTLSSSSIAPSYKDKGNIIVWFFSEESKGYFEGYNVTTLPNSLTYSIAPGRTPFEVKGKWALEIANEEGVIN